MTIFLLFIEFVFRTAPLKSIEYQAGKYNEKIHLFTYMPDSKLVRTNIRGEKIIRDVNKSGFLDIDHTYKKNPGKFRIGFFGDSYVEAKQVLIEDTFFRIIGDSLSKNDVEVLAFGNSGWGTCHSYAVSDEFSSVYDIDQVIYVFSENDLGDQVFDIKKAKSMSYPYLDEEEQIALDHSLAISHASQRESFRMLEYTYRKSYLIQNLYRRYLYLKNYGIKISADEDDMKMSSKQLKESNLSPGTLPSFWTQNKINEATLLAGKMINKWRNDVVSKNKNFAVIYVPREGEWKKPILEQDSWKKWLKEFCKNNDIEFIDPTNKFFDMSSSGAKLYDDHLAPAGHKAFSYAFIEWFLYQRDLLVLN